MWWWYIVVVVARRYTLRLNCHRGGVVRAGSRKSGLFVLKVLLQINMRCMTEDYIFAIDIGSSSCRCAVYADVCNENDHLVHLVQLPVSTSSMGTFDADEIVRCVDSCVGKALDFVRNKRYGSRFRVRAVGFDCFAMSLVGCVLGDGAGLCAVTPVYTYANGHPKKEKYTNELKRRVANLPPAAGLDLWSLHQETGTPIHASYAAPQLLCLRQEQPDLFRQVRRWTTLTTYILSKWTVH